MGELEPQFIRRLHFNDRQLADVKKFCQQEVFRLNRDEIRYELESFVASALQSRDAKFLGGSRVDWKFQIQVCIGFSAKKIFGIYCHK